MIFYDISMTIKEQMAVYKDKEEKRPHLIVKSDFSNSPVYETRLELDLHTGTHIDMPRHVFPDGTTSEHWGHEEFFTRCVVLDFTSSDDEMVTARHLEDKDTEKHISNPTIKRGKTVLLKTKNSLQDAFDFNFTYLARSGAAYLAKKNIRGVGIDALGIERNQAGHATHKLLLKAGIWIIEGLCLREVPEGDYILAVMPLKVRGVEAMPARAVLLDPNAMLIP